MNNWSKMEQKTAIEQPKETAAACTPEEIRWDEGTSVDCEEKVTGIQWEADEADGVEDAPKVLRRDVESFIDVSARVSRQVAEEYRRDLVDKGEYSAEEIDRFVAEKQQEVAREMASDYLGVQQSENISETEENTVGETEQMESGKMLFGFGRREVTETKQEVRERLEQCGVQDVQLDGVLERYQELIAKDVEEMCESYPELKGYIGRICARDLEDGVFACAGPRMGADGYTTEIWVNKEIFSEGGLEGRVRNCESLNWRGEPWLAGHGTDAVLKHEMAHILHLRLIAEDQGMELGSKDRSAYELLQEKYDRNYIVCMLCYDVMKQEGISPKDLAAELSVYGSRNMGECFAEAISEYETRKHPRQYATAVYEEYKRRVNKS